jgi:hypothetical protein
MKLCDTIVSQLQIARMAEARLADVDRRDARLGLVHRMPGRLRGAAAGDQDSLVCARGLGRKHPMPDGAAATRVEVPVLVQAGERRRVGHPLIEVADLFARVHSMPSRPVIVVEKRSTGAIETSRPRRPLVLVTSSSSA